MNFYLRYFNDETLVSTADEAINFLYSLREIDLTPQMEQDVRQYLSSDVRYPKRYKVRAHAYFIIIKTDARNMEEFKSHRNAKDETAPAADDVPAEAPAREASLKQQLLLGLRHHRPGWYEGDMMFKRVTQDPRTGKYIYRDTRFVAQVKADSGMDCYQRMVDHLQQRVDQRSQFPSVKGKNFQFTFLGKAR